MNVIRTKMNINSNQFNLMYNVQNTENNLSMSGIDTLINIINYDLIIKEAKFYPKQIKDIIPKFYKDITIINNFLSIIILTTNVYDTISVFNLINILDQLFNANYQYIDFDKEKLRNNIDYTLIKKAFYIIVKSDNCLSIAKYIWFYYKNISILNYRYANEIISSIVIKFFFTFFFHWSFQVREILFYFIIFILQYKIKNKIKPITEKDNNIISNNNNNEQKSFNKRMSISIFPNLNYDFKRHNTKKNCEFFYIENELNDNMDIILQLQNILKNTKNYKNIQNFVKNEKILEKIPKDAYPYAVECIKQYESVIEKFNSWKKNIDENKIANDKIEYPNMEISMIKDDIIQYEE
jgi:hypothetical protein